MSIKETILAAGRKLTPLTVPEWGGETVFLRPLTLGEFRAFQAQCRAAGEGAAKLVECQNSYVVLSLCDANGAQLMTEAELLQAPASGAERVFEAAQKLNRHGRQEEKN